MRMLRVEERLRTLQLVRMGGEKGIELLPRMPLRAEDLEALHVLDPNRLVLLVEARLPCPRAALLAVADRVRDPLGLLPLLRAAVPGPAVHVVVAVDEELLHAPPVRSRVVRKNPVPGVCGVLELGDPPPVRDVARDHDAVRTVVAKVLERLDEPVRLEVLDARTDHMHVADDAHAHLRASAQRRAGDRAASRE